MSENGQNLSELPDGWAYGTLEEVSNNIVDCLHSTPKFTDKGKYCIDTTCIEPGKILFDKVRFVPEDIYQDRVRRLVPEAGDILFAREGTIGTALVVPDNIELCLGQRMMMFRPASCILPKYYMWALSAPVFESQWKPKVTGTTAPHVNIRDLRGMVVPLAPLQQQHRIVNKIEELFTQLDAGVDLLKKLKVKLKRYRQAVLKAAVEGKLTQDWRAAHQDELEPASVLLDRILKERREKWEADQLAKMEAKGKVPKNDKWKLKYKEPPVPDTTRLLELPERWIWATFEQVSNRVTVGHVGSMKNEYVENNCKDRIPFLRSQNVRENFFDPKGLKFISRKFHEKIQKSCLQPNDLVVVRSGSVGVSCVIPEILQEANCSDLVIVKQPSGIHPMFGSYYMNSVARSHVSAQQVGVALIHFNTKSMASMAIPVPPQLEQIEIVQEVERYLSLIDQIDKSISINLKRAEKLRQSTLKRAFEGKLVPQDPNDEPASLLLERIQAEKAQQEAKSKKRKTATKKSRKTTKPKQLEITDGSNEEQAS